MKTGISKLLKVYTLGGLIKIILDILITKITISNARIIRRPFYFRGKQFMKIGNGFTSGVGLRLDCFLQKKTVCLEIGTNVQVNDYVHIACIENIYIGDNVLIGSKVFISDHNHGIYDGDNQSNPEEIPEKRFLYSAPVRIEKNSWIGENVSILPGVTIGFGAIIGANSVVTSNIPSKSIAVGAPAKVVKVFNDLTKKWDKIEFRK